MKIVGKPTPKPAVIPIPPTPAPVNSIYDVSYFDTLGNEYYSRKNNNYLWWASSDRASGSEYVEIDLGKRRGINYISFDIMRKPIDVEIQYDRIDLDNIDSYSDYLDKRWATVKKVEGSPFDSSISYNSDYTNPWKHAEFYFTDESGDFLVARRLRFKFTRRDERWPTADFKSFIYGVDVKNLRVARYISERAHLRGVLFGADSFDTTRKFKDEIRQNIIIPSTYEISPTNTTDLTAIGNFSPKKIYPRVAQYNFLIYPKDKTQTAFFEWSFVDTTSYDIVLASGVEQFAFNPNVHFDLGDVITASAFPEWAKITFPEEIEVRSDRKYQMRIRNANTQACDTYHVTSPSVNATGLSKSTIDLHEINSYGTFDRIRNTSMTYQIVANIGSSGKDLLGNEYREAVRYSDAENATDGETTTNWTCFPNPSSSGVEALYFDVRELIDGKYVSSVLDAINVTTLTPGVRMNVYFSEQAVDGVPDRIEEWENMMWTPLRGSYKLNSKQTLDLPYPIKANWICLEFYNLQAMPMELPNYPILPEVVYKEFPQWVVEANSTTIAVNDQAVLEKEKFVSFTIPEVMAPEVENSNGLRMYPEVPLTLEQNYAINGFGYADPKLLSRISISENHFAQPTIKKVDTETLLGANVYEKYSTDLTTTFASESTRYPRIVNTRSVSNTNNRYEFSRTEEQSLLFNRVCAHQYAVKRARFNKKAYFVSIAEVGFARKDYSIEADDPVIHDVLVYQDALQSPFIEESSWEPEQKISIPVGGSVFVSYEINGATYDDELIYFESGDGVEVSFEPVDLPGIGGIATNVIARSAPFGKGETYYRNQDFLIVYDAASKKNRIQRNDIPARLVISQIDNTLDKFTVKGSGIIITETIGTDDISLSDPTAVGSLIGGSSLMSGEMTVGLGNASITSTTTTYATLDDE